MKCKYPKLLSMFLLKIHILLIFGLIILSPTLSGAQTIDQGGGYISQVDNNLTIRKVSVLPVVDNLEGIYARPIEAQLISLCKQQHQWDYSESQISTPLPVSSDLEENPDLLLKSIRGIDSDVVFLATASKGPSGLSIKLDMFLKYDGRLFAQEILKDHPRFDLSDIREQVQILFKKVIAKIPYQGMVLSRQQNRITLNLGKTDGLAPEQVLTAIQIIKEVRHPKFNFLVNTEKEIIGKIKIMKVDDTLSFGSIISEKEKGSIRKFSKVSGIEFVQYSNPADLGSGVGQGENISDRLDSETSFGKNPKEWLPTHNPSFGAVGISLGLGQFTSNMKLMAAGNLEANAPYYPYLGLYGELWLTSNWTMRGELSEGIISTSNPMSGSSPANLNQSMTRYSLTAGYNFLFQNDFFGPKIQVRGGFAGYRMYVDDSAPRGLVTVQYYGMVFGVNGSFPLDNRREWYIGAELNLSPFASMSEEPVSSGGSPKNSVNDFGFFARNKLKENLYLSGAMNFYLYSTTFSGPGTRGDGSSITNDAATSLSQRHMVLNAGIEYLF